MVVVVFCRVPSIFSSFKFIQCTAFLAKANIFLFFVWFKKVYYSMGCSIVEMHQFI